jgi:hypothetical protein
MSDPHSVGHQLGAMVSTHEFLKEQMAEVRADLRRHDDTTRDIQRDIAELGAAVKSLTTDVAALALPVNQYIATRARLSSFGMFVGAIALVLGLVVGPVWPDVLHKLFPWLVQ